MSQNGYLSVLFPSLKPAGFLNGYWPTRPVHYHGNPGRLGGLVELGDLGALVALATRSRLQMKAMLQGESGHSEVTIQPADILSLYSVGATIACADVHRWRPEVACWVDGLREELGVPDPLGGCNLYLTPPGHGVPMHFDDHEVIVVQLSGRKLWKIAPNTVVSHPLHNAGRTLEGEVRRYAAGPPPACMPPGRRVAMRPGSVLFLPRGYWHETDARERSVSLTFGFKTPCWLDVLQRHLNAALTLHPDWREAAWGVWNDAEHREQADKRWTKLRDDLIRHLDKISLDSIVPAAPDQASTKQRRRRGFSNQ